MRWILLMLPLAACDVAPRPIDLERSFIETPDEGYQVIADFMTAMLTTQWIASECDTYEADRVRQQAFIDWLEADLNRLAAEDPETFNDTMTLTGMPVTAEEWLKNGGGGMFPDRPGLGFLGARLGVGIDALTRLIGAGVRTRGDFNCASAEREIAQGTLAGSFLKPVPEDQPGGLTVSVPEAPRVDASKQAASSQINQPVN